MNTSNLAWDVDALEREPMNDADDHQGDSPSVTRISRIVPRRMDRSFPDETGLTIDGADREPINAVEEIDALVARASIPLPAGESPFADESVRRSLEHLYEQAIAYELLGDATEARRCLAVVLGVDPCYRDASARMRAISQWPTIVPGAQTPGADIETAPTRLSA